MALTVIALVLFGLALGSFINALVWRLKKQTVSKSKKFSILSGRSICPSCGHKLAPKDLIPLISWLWLRGKCSYCKKPISLQYPLVELITTGVFVFSYFFWPYNFSGYGTFLFILWLAFLVIFIALFVYDLLWQLLPNKLVFPLIVISLVQLVVSLFNVTSVSNYLFNVLLSLIILPGLFYLLFILSNGKWIGGGDVKLAVALAILLASPGKSLLTLFLSSVLGTLVAIPLIISKKANTKSRVAYGPHLIAASFIVYLFGQHIINWYLSIFKL